MKLERILVIDDQPADQMLAKYAIQSYNPNAEILEAYDGVEALEILDSLALPPDIIFLDINMPRMNGFEFLEAYRASAEKIQVVVMLTSSDQEADKEKCEQYPFVAAYETKPISAQILEHLEAHAK
ncbi:MAG: response regulator [Pseudomonadales bacterium]